MREKSPESQAFGQVPAARRILQVRTRVLPISETWKSMM